MDGKLATTRAQHRYECAWRVRYNTALFLYLAAVLDWREAARAQRQVWEDWQNEAKEEVST